ncbi:MAG: PD-(D/E)XK nuclease family protein [Pseudohongiellaceae bacterium]
MPISRIDLTPMASALKNGATILVPSLRIKDAILAEIHGNETRSSYPTAIIHPIDVWIKELWQLRGVAGNEPCCNWQLMDAAEERFIWAQIVESSQTSIPLLNPDETAAQVSQSYQDIRQWDLWETLTESEAHYQANLDVETFVGWAREFQNICAEKQLIGLVDCTRELAKSFTAADTLFLPREIFLSNFDDPPPLYKKLFENLASVTNLNSGVGQAKTQRCNSVRYVFSDRDHELKCCSQWALDISKANPDAHIGIIMPSAVSDKGSIVRRFDETFNSHHVLSPLDKEVIFNSTGDSAPLTEFAVVHDALSLLSFLFSELDSNEVCRLLQSPFLVSDNDERESLLHAQLLARRHLSASCNASELAGLLDNPEHPAYSPKFGSALLEAKTLIRRSGRKLTPRQWASLFEEILTIFNWPGSSFSMDEKKLLTLWGEGLNLFAKSNVSLGKIVYQQAVSKFRGILKNLAPRPGFSSRRQLSLYTVSEAVGLRFDYAWLLGFDDQSWPQPSSPSPFLPYELQRNHNMPASHGENQFIIATQSFAALTGNVDREIVTSHHQSENDQELRASSFIKPIPEAEAPSAEIWLLNSYCQNQFESTLVEHTDISPPSLAGSEIVKGGQSVLSNQSSCPFRGFAKHRLKANPLDQFSSGLSSMTRGTALHIAMEAFYSKVDDLKRLNSLPPEQLADAINLACKEAVDFLQTRFKRVMTPRFSEIEQLRLEGLLSLFIDLDKNRKDFSVVAQEKMYQWQHGNLNLTLKVDRIDQLVNNSLALIDYKTGKHPASKSSWLEQRPEDMQLPLYFVAASAVEEDKVSTLAIAHVNIEKIEYSGLTGTNEFHEKLKSVSQDEKIEYSWDELTQHWEERVRSVAQEFVEGKNVVNPVNDEKTCLYCGLQPLCRVQYLRNRDEDPNGAAIEEGSL